jgi:hypothetical protein
MQRDRLLAVLRRVSEGTCNVCANNARKVLDGRGEGDDAAWRVVASAAGCTWLDADDRELARRALD